MKNKLLSIVAAGMLVTPAAFASVTITQGSSAPTYSTTLNFDEAGGPTGALASDAYAGIGISSLTAGDGSGLVDDWATITGQPWLGENNSLFGNFGVFITFDTDISEFSLRAWDPSGAPSPFGGGFGVFVFNDGVEVANMVGEAAYGGVGDEWYDIITSGGVVFDEVRLLGFGFSPETFVDDLSWNAAPVPLPGAFLFMASCLVGLGFNKRSKSA